MKKEKKFKNKKINKETNLNGSGIFDFCVFLVSMVLIVELAKERNKTTNKL